MADANKTVMSVVITGQNSKLSDFAIGDRQLIFVSDKRKIALDFNGKRTFYNQIESLTTESERKALEDPVEGLFYFVQNPISLWVYTNAEWHNIATASNDAVFIGDLIPETGIENKLYVNKLNKEISIWDTESNDYIVVANKCEGMSESDIDALFQ